MPAAFLNGPPAAAADSAAMANRFTLLPASPDCEAERTVPRASPVVLANVLYTAFPNGLSQPTEAKSPGGRMAAVRIYDPAIPDQTLAGDQILWEVGQVLAAGDPDERRILFADNGALRPFVRQTVTAKMLALGTQTTGAGPLRCDFNADGAVDSIDVEWLVQWVQTPRRTGVVGQPADWPLGRIDQSVPALMVPPPALAGRFDSGTDARQRQLYRQFSANLRDRPTVLFVGSADGLLHAIDAGSFRWGDNPYTPDIREQRGYFQWEPQTAEPPDYCFAYDGRCPNYGTGRELWAFIPSNLLARLKYHLTSGGDPASMNASPAVADAYLDTDNDGLSDTWRTVLLSAQGSGGDGVFCLDVTDPHRPALMWETAAPELVRQQAPPATVRIGRILDVPSGRSRWAAFLVSGEIQAEEAFPTLLIFDVSTGRLLERVVLDAAVDRDGDGLLQPHEVTYGRGGVAGSRPALVDADANGLIDRVYVSSDKGLVYKIVVPDRPDREADGISHCVFNTDFSAADGRTIPIDRRYQPISTSPTVEADGKKYSEGEGSVWVFFGTGGQEFYGQSQPSFGARHLFFAYTDDAGTRGCDPRAHQLQWFIELAPGEHVETDAFTAAGRVYFDTAPTTWENRCTGASGLSEKEGSLAAVDLDGAVLFKRSLPAVLSSPLVEDLHLYVTLPGGTVSFGAGVYNNPSQASERLQVRIKAWQQVE